MGEIRQLKQFKLFIPLLSLILIIVILWHGLSLHPNQIPSPLINKQAPEINLPNLMNNNLTTSADYLGHITLVNVWATWCNACASEHPFLMHISKDRDLVLYGLNYKDDASAAKKWLEENGNPYQYIAYDQDGKTAINWGVYGTPETFVLDKNGIIRYKIIGAINENIWENELKPVIARLRSEP